MSLQNLSGATYLIRPNVAPGVVDATSRPLDTYRFFAQNGLIVQPGGSAPFSWNIQNATTTNAGTFTENQAVPAPNQRKFIRATVSPVYWWVTAGITGHLLDNIRNGGMYDPNAESAEVTNATLDMMYAIDSALRGSTADFGLLSCVDSTDVYATLNPGSIAQWNSVEIAASTMDLADWQDLYIGQHSAPHNGQCSAYLCSMIGEQKYLNLCGPGASSFRVPIGSQMDFGAQRMASSYNGKPIIALNGFSDTEVLGLDLSRQSGSSFPGVCLVTHRMLQSEMLAKTNDNPAAQLITVAMALRIESRVRQAKMIFS